MVWTGQNFSVGQILTAAQMTNLQNDIAAAFAKDSGAPVLANNYITDAMIATDTILAGSISADACGQSELAANSVGQSEVKTTYQELSLAGAYDTCTTGDYTFSGGTYGLFFQMRVANALSRGMYYPSSGQATTTSFVSKVGLQNCSSSYESGYTAYMRFYYINSSPPYDLGDGEIPLFVFAEIATDGEILSMSLAQDPPWAYNGKTDITPSGYTKTNGVLMPYKSRKDMSAFAMTRAQSEAAGGSALSEYFAAFAVADSYNETITQELKNADMNDIGHGISKRVEGANSVDPTSTFVMLDPMSPVLAFILENMEHNEFQATEFIKDWCDIDNIALNRFSPDGLPVVGLTMRSAKRV